MENPYLSHTKTYDFLVPLLGMTTLKFGPTLINAYLGDNSVRGLDQYNIYLLLKYHAGVKSSFNRLNHWLLDHPGFQFSYDIADSRYVMYVVELPERFHGDYEKLVCKDSEGYSRYSLLSDEAKKLLKADREPTSPMSCVLDKAPKVVVTASKKVEINPKKYWEQLTGVSLGDLELWPKFNLEDETFDKDKFESFCASVPSRRSIRKHSTDHP